MKNIQHPTPNIQHPTPMDSRVRWMFGVGCWLLDVPQSLLIFGIRAYQLTISPAQIFLFGPAAGCRFTPSCSEYARDAVREHGALAGGALAVKRVCRCHPWSAGGHDPVPKREFGSRNSAFGI